MLVSVEANIPTFYHQAIRGLQADKWLTAIEKELTSMNDLAIWSVVDLMPDIKTIGTTWVFRKKPGSSPSSTEFKARLCAQGFSQTYGVDFSKTFAPTGRLNSLCTLISHAAAHDLEFEQLDVKTTFLNTELDEDVHLAIPQGVPLDGKKYCLKLKKAIYGLKQAPLAWYNRLTTWLHSVGFTVSVCDPCVFFRSDPSPLWLFVHVDDITVFGKNISFFKDQIKAEFDMKDLGKADLLLGIKIHHDPEAIILSQRHYVNSLLELYGMKTCRPTATPLVPNSQLDKASTEEMDRFKSLGVNFQSAVGALSYLSTATRPNIAFAVSNLSQFLERPGITHWEVFMHVLHYLAVTPDYALTYLCRSVADLRGFTDADWGNCPMTRRSVTGFLALQNHHLVCWKTKKQPVVSLSTCKAEYRALVDFSCKLLWLRQFCIKVGISSNHSPTVVHKDNQGCIAVANFEANTNSKRMKHVEIQLHFIRKVIKNSKIVLCYTATKDMLADFLTKSIPLPALLRSLVDIGLLRLEERGGVEV
jgi:hypothetical protein